MSEIKDLHGYFVPKENFLARMYGTFSTGDDIGGSIDPQQVETLIKNYVGDKTTLTTTEKEDLVKAINSFAPTNEGSEGQVLTKTSNSIEWSTAKGDEEAVEVAAAALVDTRDYIDSLLNGITKRGKILMSKDVVNSLTGTSTLVPLSAWMGRILHQYQLDNELVASSALNDIATLVKPTAIASLYTASKVYLIGDIVMHEGNLYKCITTIDVPEFFDVTKWEQTNIINILNS